MEKDSIQEDDIVLIYYKTGYLFEQEAVVNAGFSVFDLDSINEFLNKFRIDNAIFNDYKEFIDKKASIRKEALEAIMQNDFRYFREDYVQYEFMKLLRDACKKEKGKRVGIDKGTSPSGRPWTQYSFYHNPRAMDRCKDEFLFYRIDTRVNKESGSEEYYLAIRHYVKFDRDDKNMGEMKQKRLDDLIKKFSLLRENHSPLTIKFSEINKSAPMQFESEIAIVFFDSKQNTIKNILREFPALHETFVEGLEEPQE